MMEILAGVLIPFIGTSAGAACVFFLKKEKTPPSFLDGVLELVM